MAYFIDKLLGLLVMLVFSAPECQSNMDFGCPKKFSSIGKKCYHFSDDSLNWFQARFVCQDLNSTLVIATQSESVELRKFLNHHSKYRKYGHWMDGRYNNKTDTWIEGNSGNPLKYIGFNRFISSRKGNVTTLVWSCIKFDQNRKNKWGIDDCSKENHFICQTNNKCEEKKILTNSEKQLCQENEYSPGNFVRREEVLNVCHNNMILIGKKCYWFSKSQKNWYEAFEACKNGTKLAILNSRKNQELLLAYLNTDLIEKHERWIGAKFDDSRNEWVWARNHQELRYKNFATEVNNRNNANHSVTLDPDYENKWNSRDVSQRKYYICQANPKKIRQQIKPKNPKYVPKPQTPKHKSKEEVYTCPINMILIGRLCYFFSKTAETWSAANYACNFKHTKLVTFNSKENEEILHSFLNLELIENQERWIGGKFDAITGEWVWVNGNNSQESLHYQNFANEIINENHENHYITLDPAYRNKWNSRDGSEIKYYICQANPKKINPYLEPKKPKYAPKPQTPKLDKTKEEVYTCSIDMILIGRLCYFFSKTAETWPAANYACNYKHTKLVTFNSKESEKLLHSFLNLGLIENQERWIGGKFDAITGEWIWVNGNNSQELLRYQNFASEVINRNHEDHYITLDPFYKNLWNSKDGFKTKLYYICQAEPNRINRITQPTRSKKTSNEQNNRQVHNLKKHICGKVIPCAEIRVQNYNNINKEG